MKSTRERINSTSCWAARFQIHVHSTDSEVVFFPLWTVSFLLCQQTINFTQHKTCISINDGRPAYTAGLSFFGGHRLQSYKAIFLLLSLSFSFPHPPFPSTLSLFPSYPLSLTRTYPLIQSSGVLQAPPVGLGWARPRVVVHFEQKNSFWWQRLFEVFCKIRC